MTTPTPKTQLVGASPWEALMPTKKTVLFSTAEDAAKHVVRDGQAGSKAEKIRELLRRHGPMSSADICARVDIATTSLVGGVLKNDIEKGRVIFSQGRYVLNDEWEQSLAYQIGAAKQLLKRNGYHVEKIRK